MNAQPDPHYIDALKKKLQKNALPEKQRRVPTSTPRSPLQYKRFYLPDFETLKNDPHRFGGILIPDSLKKAGDKRWGLFGHL